MRAFVYGAIGGLVLATLLLLGNQLTGFTIITGPQTINFNEDITESTLIPINTPNQIHSLQVTGRYEGTGGVEITLIGAEESLPALTFSAPQEETVLLLGSNGTIQNSTAPVKEVFIDACQDTCLINNSGPHYIQIRVEAGAFTLSSITYTTPEQLTRIQNPPQIIPQEEQTQEDINTPQECTNNNECSAENVCIRSSCVHSTERLTITDNQDEPILIIDQDGDILLAGNLVEESTRDARQEDFRITSGSGTLAWVTNEGDLHLKGESFQELEVPAGGEEDVEIRSESTPITLFTGEGNLLTQGKIRPQALQ